MSVRETRGAVSSSRAELPRHELIGPAEAPVVLALGGISADAHVCAHDEDPRDGWWEGIVGSGRAIDPRGVRVLGVDYLDAGVRADGRPAGIVTTHDQADAIARTLDLRGIEAVSAIVGASYGGMVALSFAERFPERVERLVVIGAADFSDTRATAWRIIQRRTVELGLETGRAHDAIMIARALAMTTYRSREELERRFQGEPVLSANDAAFPVESYLRHNGERFADRFTAAHFLALSLSSDLHRGEPKRIVTPTTLVAEEGDLLVPREQLEQLARALAGQSELVDLRSDHGHDAFLTEPERLGA